MSKIIGVTVGTPLNPDKYGGGGVTSVNGQTGDVVITVTDGKDGADGYTPIKGVDYFDGSNGKDGEDGKDGYTPVKGVDYFDGKDGEDGKDGSNGNDGISPTVEVTTITGGHRVKITDANGSTVFDVMNGVDGKNGADGKDGEDGKDGNSASITVDDELSNTSTNPVQNKVITQEFAAAVEEIGGVLQQMQNAIPTTDSINALIDAKLGVIENGTY